MAAHAPVLRSPREELRLLGFDPEVWRAEVAEVRPRETRTPDGSSGRIDDGVLLLRLH